MVLPHDEALQAARLVLMEAAVSALMRGGEEQGFDALSINVTADQGETSIDLMYLKAGMPIAGHSL